MKITDVVVERFRSRSRTVSDSEGHGHPGPERETVQSLTRIVTDDQDTLDNIQLVYEFETGVTLSFGFGIFAPGGYRNTAILGSHGRLEYQRHGKTILQYAYEPGDRQAPEPIVHDLSGPMSEAGHVGTDAMYRELISALRERRFPLTAGTEMVESIRMCVAGQEAMRSRQVVTL